MRHRLFVSVLGSLALTACQFHGNAAVPVAKASPSAATGKPAQPTTAPAVKAGAVLLKPTTASRVLTATVAIDAGYLAGANKLISQDGGTLISQDGGTVLAVQANALISQDGGSLISQDGGTIVAQGGGNLIVGSDVLASDGVQPRANYRLQDAKTASTGEELPAAGMWVRVISLKDDTALPLGVDASGKPVYVVATDLDGKVTVYLPADVTENVRLVASVPHASDDRLTYNHVLTPDVPQAGTLDEDHALLTSYLRDTLQARLSEVMGRADGLADLADEIATVAPDVLDTFKQLNQDALAQHYDALSLAQQTRVVVGLGDAALSTLDLKPDGEAATPEREFLDVLKQVKDRATAQLGASGWGDAGFQLRPWVIAGQQRRTAAGKPPLAFERPSDVGAFLIDQYMGSDKTTPATELANALVDLGIGRDDAKQMRVTTRLLEAAVLQKLKANLPMLQQRLQTLVAEVKSAPPSPRPAAIATSFPAPTPGPADAVIKTIAGKAGEGGVIDGPGASARFVAAMALAADQDPTSTHLYVADAAGTIRLIRPDEPGCPVTTIVGRPPSVPDQQPYPAVDGPGATASIASVRAMACDGKYLYVAEDSTWQNGAGLLLTPPGTTGRQPASDIRRVDLTDGQYTVTTLAGSLKTAGSADGPGAAATFSDVSALALDPDGNLTVGELGDRLVRKVDLHAAGFPVSTLLGLRQPASTEDLKQVDGGPQVAPLLRVSGLTYDATGALVVVDNENVRRLDKGRNAAGGGLLSMLTGGLNAASVDGYWSEALFYSPFGITTLSNGDLLVMDGNGHSLRRVREDDRHLAATSWLVAGQRMEDQDPRALAPGVARDGTGTEAQFSLALQVAADGRGRAYVGDYGASTIRQIAFPNQPPAQSSP